jgi:nucleoside-diphosphate-sugar epimerase
MISNKNILVAGAGGFIGGHLTKYLLENSNNVTAVDIKPLEFWFQLNSNANNISLDLKKKDNCDQVTKNIDFVFNMACNMGGMGFIENNKAMCMLSVLINTHLLESCLKNKVKKLLIK